MSTARNNIIQIVIIGDSNTEGYGLPKTEQTYPYKLNEMLGNTVTVYNMGISGTCVINTKVNNQTVGMPYVLQDKYKEALNVNGDIFIINLGTNDAQDGLDDTLPIVDELSNLIKHRNRFIDDYKRILNDIIRLHPNAKIVVCIPIPVRKCIWRKHQQKYMDMIIPYYSDILKKYSNIYCIDLQSEFLELPENEIDSMFLDDGLHLNDKGTSFVTLCMKSIITELIHSNYHSAF